MIHNLVEAAANAGNPPVACTLPDGDCPELYHDPCCENGNMGHPHDCAKRQFVVEVNGQKAFVVNGTTGSVDDEDLEREADRVAFARALVEVPLEHLVHGVVGKRAAIKAAKSEYSSAGTRVKALNGELEEMLVEIERRDAATFEPELPFDDSDYDGREIGE